MWGPDLAGPCRRALPGRHLGFLRGPASPTRTILHFESGPESNIRTPDDALWWAFATITTVGYGDRFPVTGEGRVVATILMAAGVGLFGTFSGFLAAWFLGSGKGDSAGAELAEIRQELTALRATIQGLGPSAMASHEAGTDI